MDKKQNLLLMGICLPESDKKGSLWAAFFDMSEKIH